MFLWHKVLKQQTKSSFQTAPYTFHTSDGYEIRSIYYAIATQSKFLILIKCVHIEPMCVNKDG